jgi:hypothetical protein
MKVGGAALAPLGTFADKIPADILSKVKEREAQIKAGTFQVKRDDGEPKSD